MWRMVDSSGKMFLSGSGFAPNSVSSTAPLVYYLVSFRPARCMTCRNQGEKTGGLKVGVDNCCLPGDRGGSTKKKVANVSL